MAQGAGHGAWGMEHGAWGMEHGGIRPSSQTSRPIWLRAQSTGHGARGMGSMGHGAWGMEHGASVPRPKRPFVPFSAGLRARGTWSAAESRPLRREGMGHGAWGMGASVPRPNCPSSRLAQGAGRRAHGAQRDPDLFVGRAWSMEHRAWSMVIPSLVTSLRPSPLLSPCLPFSPPARCFGGQACHLVRNFVEGPT
jgi:hypothetical protein